MNDCETDKPMNALMKNSKGNPLQQKLKPKIEIENIKVEINA